MVETWLWQWPCVAGKKARPAHSIIQHNKRHVQGWVRIVRIPKTATKFSRPIAQVQRISHVHMLGRLEQETVSW